MATTNSEPPASVAPAGASEVSLAAVKLAERITEVVKGATLDVSTPAGADLDATLDEYIRQAADISKVADRVAAVQDQFPYPQGTRVTRPYDGLPLVFLLENSGAYRCISPERQAEQPAFRVDEGTCEMVDERSQSIRWYAALLKAGATGDRAAMQDLVTNELGSNMRSAYLNLWEGRDRGGAWQTHENSYAGYGEYFTRGALSVSVLGDLRAVEGRIGNDVVLCLGPGLDHDSPPPAGELTVSSGACS